MNEDYIFEVEITGDMNDGDYNTRLTTITEKEIPFIQKFAKAIKEYNKEYNFPICDGTDENIKDIENIEDIYGKQFTSKEIWEFRRFTPIEIHSIVEIKIRKIKSIEILL